MSDERWATKEVAAYLKIATDSVRRYRVRDATFPLPDGKVGASPWWRPERIIAWDRSRPGRSGRPRTRIASTPDGSASERKGVLGRLDPQGALMMWGHSATDEEEGDVR